MKSFDLLKSPLDGTNLIEASAGTGKTYAISVIYLRLIVEKGLEVEDILAVTFTRPATMELRSRIRERLAEAVRAIDGDESVERVIREIVKEHCGDQVLRLKLLAAIRGFDQASVYTIHSFCHQMLTDNAFESGSLFNIEIDNDRGDVDTAAADIWRRELYTSTPPVASYFLDRSSPEKLVNLYIKRPNSPLLKIEPDVPDIPEGEIEEAYNRTAILYGDLSTLWSEERENVREIIFRDGLLRGNIYQMRSKDAMLDDMEGYASGGNPYALPEKFNFFTSGKIEASLNKGKAYPENRIFAICQEIQDAFDLYESTARSILNRVRRDSLGQIDKAVSEKRSRRSGRSFDDLIWGAHKGVTGASGELLAERVRRRFRAALIDEFQDTDDLQFDIFNSVFNNGETILFLIGDPKQAIYRFRGADIFSYIKASKLVDRKYSMPFNWRSRPELIGAVNILFERCQNPFVFEQIEFYPVAAGRDDQGERLLLNGETIPPLHFWLKGEEEQYGGTLTGRLAFEISNLLSGDGKNRYTLDGRGIKPGDIAVIVRTKREGVEVRDALASLNVPSVARTSESVLETGEAAEMRFIISAIADPSSMRLMSAALATAALGGDSGLLFEIRNGEGASLLSDRVSRFYRYREIWSSEGFLSMFSCFMEEESVPERLFSLPGGETIVANMNHIAGIIHDESRKKGYSPRELAVWFTNLIVSPPEGEEYSTRIGRDDEAVNIVTMHASKGLEYPIVYAPFLGSSGTNRDDFTVYHDPDDGNRPVLFLDRGESERVKDINRVEDLAENARLLYVSVTRAKSACRILLDPNRYFGSSAAGHIFLKSAGYDGNDYTALLESSLTQLADTSEGAAAFSKGGVLRGSVYSGEEFGSGTISARSFTGAPAERWMTHSYSSIVHHGRRHASDGMDFQSEYHQSYDGEGIFSFEAGARAGLCVHEIFEKGDFTERDFSRITSLCGEILEKYRFNLSFAPVLAGMFFNTVNVKLDPGSGLRLSSIAMNSRLSELEFHFPVERIDYKELAALFSGKGEYCNVVSETLDFPGSDPGGLMKGFIDLVFEQDGKYYIADWKSNHLGGSPGNYTVSELAAEMKRHNYFLQYYIYTVALHRYLSARLGPVYSFDEHFGGVYYFFVRGIGNDPDDARGIFRDRPEWSVVEKLDEFFRRSANGHSS